MSVRGTIAELLDASFPLHLSSSSIFSLETPNHIVAASLKRKKKKESFSLFFLHIPICSINLDRPQYIGGGAAALMKPTVIKAPQPRVGDIAILLVMMRRGIASRAVHGGNPKRSAVLLGKKSSVNRRETSSGSDME